MKVDRSNELLLQGLKQREHGQEKAASVRNQGIAASDKIDLATPVRIGQSVVYVSLSKSLSLDGKAFTPNASSSQAAGATEGEVTPTDDNPLGFDYKAVAKSVLSFVTGYIRLAQAEGKDDEKLKDLLTQARKGIDQGFGDARKELKGTGVFSDDLDKGIEKGYGLIQDELGKFEEELFGKKPEADGTSMVGDVNLSASLATGSYASMELTTREGDKVTLQFDQQQSWRYQQGKSSGAASRKALDAYGGTERASSTNQGKSLAAESAQNSKENSKVGNYSIYYSHTTAFSFSVEGDLNPDELKAIGSLVDQVGSLSDSFFGGDLQGALDQAQSLSMDDSQLVNMSLSLQQRQSAMLSGSVPTSLGDVKEQSATDADTTAASDAEKPVSSVPDLSQFFGPFADYLDRLQSLIKQANTLFDDKQQKNLNDWVVANQQGASGEALQQASGEFTSFNQRMHNALAALSK